MLCVYRCVAMHYILYTAFDSSGVRALCCPLPFLPGPPPPTSSVLPSPSSALVPPDSGGHRAVSVFWEEEGQTENVRLLVILVKRLDVLWLVVSVCRGR